MSDLGRLLGFVRPFKYRVALAVALGATTVGSGVALMALSAYLISAAALHPSIAELSVAIVGVRFFGIARGGFRYLERLVSHSVNFRLLARLRAWFYRAVEPLAPARLTGLQSGDLLQRAVGDVETLQDFYVRVLAPPLVALLVAGGMGLFLWQFDGRLAALLLGLFALGGPGLAAAVRVMSRRPGAEAVARRAALHAALVESIQGAADIAAFGRQAGAVDKVRRLTESLAEAQGRLGWLRAGQVGVSTLLENLGFWAVLAAGVALVSAGRLDGVYLGVLALASAAAFEAIQPLPQAALGLESALAAARRLFAIAETPPAVAAPARPAPPPRCAAGCNLEIRNLRFTYPGSRRPALDGVSLDLPAGRHVAIVGPSGAGKSTLVNLLLRFWDCGEGQIRLDGVDIRDHAPEDVRAAVGVIAQQAYVFNATIRENILVARPQAGGDEMRLAAQRAQLHDFIESLPLKYDTWAGERGLALSAGQRQRLGIARAMLRDAPIAVLDEPTAHLDPITEREMLQSAFDGFGDRTLLLVTHRLVGLEWFDEILVLRAGRVVERGSHAALLRAGGLYRRMWDLQRRPLQSR